MRIQMQQSESEAELALCFFTNQLAEYSEKINSQVYPNMFLLYTTILKSNAIEILNEEKIICSPEILL